LCIFRKKCFLALIVKKEDFEEVKKDIEDNRHTLNSIKDLENLHSFEKILNKNDLVCIFHQKKDRKDWKEDTKEFEEWNKKVLDLVKERKLTDKDFHSLDEDNEVKFKNKANFNKVNFKKEAVFNKVNFDSNADFFQSN